MKISRITTGALVALTLGTILAGRSVTAAEEPRELVKLPAMMQEHMLANMRDHLVAMEEILSALASGRADDAAKIAEGRLGMSSLTLHGAARMGKFMPEDMRKIGTQLHHAASRFVIAVQNAELDPSVKSQRNVYKALQGITENCNACHRAYRIR